MPTRRLPLAVSILALAVLLLAADTPSPSAFGAALRLSEPTSLEQVLAAPERYTDAPILLRGRLTDLCQKKGCWTVLQDGDAVVRVRFEDYGFFLPQDALGRTALVEGVASIREVSEAEARHLARESRDGDPGTLEGPQREVGIVATGVRLLPRE
jgi:hypothetical protein